MKSVNLTPCAHECPLYFILFLHMVEWFSFVHIVTPRLDILEESQLVQVRIDIASSPLEQKEHRRSARKGRCFYFVTFVENIWGHVPHDVLTPRHLSRSLCRAFYYRRRSLCRPLYYLLVFVSMYSGSICVYLHPHTHKSTHTHKPHIFTHPLGQTRLPLWEHVFAIVFICTQTGTNSTTHSWEHHVVFQLRRRLALSRLQMQGNHGTVSTS